MHCRNNSVPNKKPAEAAASIPNMIPVQIGPHPDELATTRLNLCVYTYVYTPKRIFNYI